MVFASPIWLWGLLPWAAVVLYLLPGRGIATQVPFVKLWRGTAVDARRPNRRWPGISLVMLLLAMLAALIASAQPQATADSPAAGEINIILDRGASMALPSDSGRSFRGVIERCENQLHVSPGAKIILIPVPGKPIDISGEHWAEIAQHLSPTVLHVDLNEAVESRLRQSHGPVVVLSDQTIRSSDPRIVRIAPEAAKPGIEITAMAASLLPHPQVLVRILNRSDQKKASLRIRSANSETTKEFNLPPRGTSADQFIDIEKISENITATLLQADAQDPWSHAYLVKSGDGIKLQVSSSIDPAIHHMVEIYRNHRFADPEAPAVWITSAPLAPDVPGFWVVPVSAARTDETRMSPSPAITGSNTDLTQHVLSWPTIGPAVSPPDGFLPVVEEAGRCMVAMREKPVRQVWIKADLSRWEKTTDFVVFCGNVFDWMAAGGQRYRSESPARLADSWRPIEVQASHQTPQPGEWPGIYHSDATGQSIAVDARSFPELKAGILDTATVPFSKAVLQRSSLVTPCIWYSLACLFLGVVLWSHRG